MKDLSRAVSQEKYEVKEPKQEGHSFSALMLFSLLISLTLMVVLYIGTIQPLEDQVGKVYFFDGNKLIGVDENVLLVAFDERLRVDENFLSLHEQRLNNIELVVSQNYNDLNAVISYLVEQQEAR